MHILHDGTDIVIGGQNVFFHGTLYYVLGDTPAAQFLGGFKEDVSLAVKPYAFKRMYPNDSKCNAKRCVCCTHLCTRTTITSSVNGGQFSIMNNNDMD